MHRALDFQALEVPGFAPLRITRTRNGKVFSSGRLIALGLGLRVFAFLGFWILSVPALYDKPHMHTCHFG